MFFFSCPRNTATSCVSILDFCYPVTFWFVLPHGFRKQHSVELPRSCFNFLFSLQTLLFLLNQIVKLLKHHQSGKRLLDLEASNGWLNTSAGLWTGG